MNEGWQFVSLILGIGVALLTAGSIVGSAFYLVARVSTALSNLIQVVGELRVELNALRTVVQEHNTRLALLENAKIQHSQQEKKP